MITPKKCNPKEAAIREGGTSNSKEAAIREGDTSNPKEAAIRGGDTSLFVVVIIDQYHTSACYAESERVRQSQMGDKTRVMVWVTIIY